MSQKAKKVREILEGVFESTIVKNSSDGFKINLNELNDVQIINLSHLSTEKACDVKVRRSGTGVVVLIKI